MPRLTTQKYLELHKILHGQWVTDPKPFSLITPAEQWDLHIYFQLSKDLTNDELLTHRKAVSATDPSLPQRAGRALKQLLAANEQAQVAALKSAAVPARSATVRIYPLLKPDIDTRKIARALINQARLARRST